MTGETTAEQIEDLGAPGFGRAPDRRDEAERDWSVRLPVRSRMTTGPRFQSEEVITHLEAAGLAALCFRLTTLAGPAGGAGVGLHRVDDSFSASRSVTLEHIELRAGSRGETSRCRAHAEARAGASAGRRRRDSGRGQPRGAGNARQAVAKLFEVSMA